MDKKIFTNQLKERIRGKWMSKGDAVTEWIEFFPIPSENELGKFIRANSEDFIINRKRLEYELDISDDLKIVTIKVYDKNENLMTPYNLNLLNSAAGFLWLDKPNGEYLHYEKIPSPS